MLIQTVGLFLIVLIPSSLFNKIINLITSIRNYLLILHPRTIYSNYKHRSALRRIENSIKSIQKYIKIIPDEQKKEIRDRLLQKIFDQHPKSVNDEGVQCQIIAFKMPEIKTYKPDNYQPLKFGTITPTVKIQSANVTNNSSILSTTTPYQIKTKQEYKKQTTIQTPTTNRIYTPIRTPITQSISLKRSDVLVTQQTPPKTTLANSSHNFMKKSTPVPITKPELGQKFNLSMSQYSDLFQEQQSPLPVRTLLTQSQQQSKVQKPKASEPPKSTKKLISKVDIYMQSVTDATKLQKLYLSLYEGDEIQLTTMNNTVLEQIILLKIIDLKNGYHEAKGYSSVSGMCSKVFKFKGDFTEFNKYIQK